VLKLVIMLYHDNDQAKEQLLKLVNAKFTGEVGEPVQPEVKEIISGYQIVYDLSAHETDFKDNSAPFRATVKLIYANKHIFGDLEATLVH